MFSVIFGILINGTSDPLKVNIWLVPIILGVGWSAVGSKIMAGQDILADINMTAFGGAMTSNVAFALRGLLSKRVKAESKSENLTSSNLYSVLTLISFFLYMYNEMAYLVLGEVSATPQAVANTVKRVV